jgi:hypothetical protein
LAEVLQHPRRYPADALLLISFEVPWSTKSDVVVVRKDENANGAKESEGMKYALTIGQIQDIRENAAMQVRAPSLELGFEAFCFYYDNDAFIDLSGRAEGR